MHSSRLNLILALILSLSLMPNCGTVNPLEQYHSYEDKTVFELVDRLNKNPNDREAAALLPEAWRAALEKRKESIILQKNQGHLGDRWMEIAKERSVTKQMYDAIKASEAASKVLPDIRDPSPGIARARDHAAEEYYNQGLEYMNYNNREYARQAYDFFSRANNAVPGYKNVNSLLQEAREMSMLRVVVNPVDYYHNGFSYWGFQNDWLQQQMVRDLNNGSWNNTRFYTDWEARSRQIRADRVVDLNFTDIYISNIFNDSYTIERTKRIKVGDSKSNPPRPIFETVRATVLVRRHYLQSRASLQCRIYDWATGRNILYDRFPDSYNWKVETATYRGDQRALEPSDWALINNKWDDRPPTRNQVADHLIRNCYGQLLSRIRSGVEF